jgi:hypothetical protein
MVESSAAASFRTIAYRLGPPKTICDIGLYPTHIHNVHAVQPDDHFARERFSHCLLRNLVLCAKIVFTVEIFVNKDERRNAQLFTSCFFRRKNLTQSQKKHFQSRFLVIIWCRIIGSLLSERFELEDRLTG